MDKTILYEPMKKLLSDYNEQSICFPNTFLKDLPQRWLRASTAYMPFAFCHGFYRPRAATDG
jgi:hypothetical protein